MKKAIAGVAALSAVVGLSGCLVASPVAGALFTSVKFPGALGPGSGTKMGKSEAMSVLGWVGIGDASTTTAAANGGITQIHHIDYESFSVLGIFGTFTTNVYGN